MTKENTWTTFAFTMNNLTDDQRDDVESRVKNLLGDMNIIHDLKDSSDVVTDSGVF